MLPDETEVSLVHHAGRGNMILRQLAGGVAAPARVLRGLRVGAGGVAVGRRVVLRHEAVIAKGRVAGVLEGRAGVLGHSITLLGCFAWDQVGRHSFCC